MNYTSILCQTSLFLWMERKFFLNELVRPNAHSKLLSMKIFVGRKNFFSNFFLKFLKMNSLEISWSEFKSAWKTDRAINWFFFFTFLDEKVVYSMFRLVSELQIVQCVQCSVLNVQRSYTVMLLCQLQSNLKFYKY